MNRPEGEPFISRGPTTFRQRDAAALIRAAKAAGYEVAGVEFDPVTRKVRVLTTGGKNPAVNQEVEIDPNEWDICFAEKHNKPPAK